MLRQQVVKANFLYFMTVITTVAQYTLYTIQLLFVHKEDVAWNSLGFIIQSQPTGINTTMTGWGSTLPVDIVHPATFYIWNIWYTQTLNCADGKDYLSDIVYCPNTTIRSIFSRLPVIASETREISRNSKRIWHYSSSRSSILVSVESRYVTFY